MKSKILAIVLIALLSILLLVLLLRIREENAALLNQPIQSNVLDTEQGFEKTDTGKNSADIIHPDMQAALDSISVSVDELNDCSQLVVVSANGNTAKLVRYQLEDSKWKPEEEYEAHVGYNGVTTEKTEGDRKTPCGLYRIGFAFGNKQKPETLLPYREITENSYWVDDPQSEYYNTWVEGTEKKDWISAEHLSEYYSAYSYAAVIEYNANPIVPGAGSAIFLHCGETPTAGCVSVSEDNMLKLLSWLDPSLKPMILIFAEEQQ